MICANLWAKENFYYNEKDIGETNYYSKSIGADG